MDKIFFRRNLPHLYYNDGIYFITFRLANSISIDKLQALRTEQKRNKKSRIFLKYEALLESCEFGETYLANPEIAYIIVQALKYYDDKEYRLICYTIMPNQVHVVFELLKSNKGVTKIMQSIKRFTARKCNLILNRSGQFWQDESFDRLLRDERELYLVIKYVLLNPVKCGLVKVWSDWNFTYCNKHYEVFD